MGRPIWDCLFARVLSYGVFGFSMRYGCLDLRPRGQVTLKTRTTRALTELRVRICHRQNCVLVGIHLLLSGFRIGSKRLQAG